MAKTKTIPVRLSPDMLQRLEAVAEKISTTKAGIIRFCTDTWLAHFEKTGVASLPPNWKEIMESFDGRRTEKPVKAYPRGRRNSKAALNDASK